MKWLLNLVEILKNCPKGMELDCTMFYNVTFDGIIEDSFYPIKVAKEDGTTMMLTKYGQYMDDAFAKCIIFPKGETTWEGFVPPHKFKDGDILSYQCGTLQNRTIYIYRYRERFNTGYYVALSGDPDAELMIDNKGVWAINGYNDTARFATEEERQKLFKAIKDNGYEWNAETKTLKKLVKHKPKFKVGDKIVNRFCIYKGHIGHKGVISEITEDKYILNDGGYIDIKEQGFWELDNDKKQRFDPKTLQPFDKVLARDTENPNWRGTLFSHYIKSDGVSYPCVTVGEVFSVCIPYNEDTKHLVGTDDEAPEYYRYWED